MKLNIIHNLNCLIGLSKLPDRIVHTCVTSPPYYGLRDYGNNDQLGLEDTPELYIEKLVQIFREVKRVLRDDGTIWVNIGDSYATSGKNRSAEQAVSKSTLGGGKQTQLQILKQKSKITGTLKNKDLIGIPWMLAFALRADGWYLRQDIIWHKPNPMPESVTDRCTKAHEYIFLLSKSSKYFYDHNAIKTKSKNSADDKRRLMQQSETNKSMPSKRLNGLRPMKISDIIISTKECGHNRSHQGFNNNWDNMSREQQMMNGANKRSVWTVATKPFKEAHFATFPPELIVDCIKASCPSLGGGIVLDPFMGAGTTALVAKRLGHNYIGFELNAEYIKIAKKRIQLNNK